MIRLDFEVPGRRLVVGASPEHEKISVTGAVVTDEMTLEEPYDDVVEARIPQRLRSARFVAKDIEISGKLEVQDHLEVRAETIQAATVRGTSIRLEAPEVLSKRLVEAETLDVTATRAQLAKVQAIDATIAADDLAIESAYCSHLRVDGGKNLRVHTFHGHIDAACDTVELERVSGSATVVCDEATVHFDTAAPRHSRIDAHHDLHLRLCRDDHLDLVLDAPTLRLPETSSFAILQDDQLHDRRRIVARIQQEDHHHHRRGAGKVDVAGASAQRWHSAVESSEVPQGGASLSASSHFGILTLAEPLSWIDSIRYTVDLQSWDR